FGQAAHLAFLPWLLLIQNKASLRIHDREGARGLQHATSGQEERERKKSYEKAAWNSHEKVKPLHLNRRGLVGNRQSNTGLDSARLCRHASHPEVANPQRLLELVERYSRPFAVAESIRLEHEVDAFSCINEI